MILTKQQAAVLERLRIAHGVEPGLPVRLSRGETSAANRLVEQGLVQRVEQRGVVLCALTDKGRQALERQVQQLRMFVREPGIDDPREADAFRQLEEAVRAWLVLRPPEWTAGAQEEELHVKAALDGLDAARQRAVRA